MADFNVDLPNWENEGATPSENLQTKGFQAYDKPPAPVFNYLFNRFTSALKELRLKIGSETIPENSDLNDYLAVGRYVQFEVSKAQTIANNPFVTANINTGFFLEVIQTEGGSSLQILYGVRAGNIYKRRYSSDDDSWTDWVGMATEKHSHAISDVTDLQTQLNKKATSVNLTNQVEVHDYGVGVIALCEVTTTDNAWLNSYSVGNIYFHRENGIKGARMIKVLAENQYSKANYFNFSYLSNLELNSNMNATSGNGFRPCTFKYNDTYYGGLLIYIDNPKMQRVYFQGVTNIDMFGVEFYNRNTSEILNEEIYNSLNFGQWDLTGGTFYAPKYAGEMMPTVVNIPENADLNNYKTSGKYEQFEVSKAQTLINNPLSSVNTGISLEVTTTAGGSVLQVLYGVMRGEIYKRRYSSSTDSWNDWYKTYTNENGVPAADVKAGTFSSGMACTTPTANTHLANKSYVDTEVAKKANTSHTQAASTITEGTLAGRVSANYTAMQTVGTAQLRNINAVAYDLTAGTSDMNTGCITFVYE